MRLKQTTFQKIIIFSALVVTCMLFVLILGYATDIYSLNYHSDPSSTLLYVKGAELYNQIQPFNKLMLRNVTILMGLCLSMFVTLTHRRRLYYASNYITTFAYSAYMGYLAAILLVNTLYIKQLYLNIDFEEMKKITEMLDLRYVDSTFMLDAGIVLSFAMFLVAAGLIVNLVWKTLYMKKERSIEKGALS